MVNASLAGAHPLRNNCGEDVSRLADIFHLLFTHYAFNSSPMTADFIQSLRTLVGLGFTACLANGSYMGCYQPYLHCFLKSDQGDFRKHLDSLILLSQAMANMILLAQSSFRFLSNAHYQDDFIAILKNILENVILKKGGKSQDVKKILSLFE